MTCIELRNVSKTLDGRKVLDSISFAVSKGEVVAVSGIPETSAAQLMTIASGYSNPDSGTVEVLKTLPGNYKSGGKSYSLWRIETFPPYLTPMRFIALCSKYYGFGISAGKRALRETGLWDLRNLKYEKLSAEEKRRFCMAPLLCANPKVVFVESLFPPDDREAGELFQKILARLSSSETAFMICTDSLSRLRGVATRVILLRDGAIASDARMNDIVSARAGGGTRIRVSDVAAASAVVPEAKVERDCLVLGKGVTAIGPLITKLENSGITILSVEKGNAWFPLDTEVTQR